MRSEHELAVFDEGAVVAQVFDVFARGALALRMAAFDGVGSVFVQRGLAPFDHFFQVRADFVEIDVILDGVSRPRNRHGFDRQQRVLFVNGVADPDMDIRNDAADTGSDLMFHLHRIHDQQRHALGHLLSHLDIDRDDGALHR